MLAPATGWPVCFQPDPGGPEGAPRPADSFGESGVGNPADVGGKDRSVPPLLGRTRPEPRLRETGTRPAARQLLPPALPSHRPPPALCSQGSEAASKGDFLFSSDHLIEMATKLYRTTLSQTRQKLNIEISDEYVRGLLAHPGRLPAAWVWGGRDLSSLVHAAPTLRAPRVCLVGSRGRVGRGRPGACLPAPDFLVGEERGTSQGTG